MSLRPLAMRRLIRGLLAAGLILGLAGPVATEELADPTRSSAAVDEPRALVAPSPTEDAEADETADPADALADIRVRMIRITDDDAVARIEGPDGERRSVRPGDPVGNTEVLHIEPRGVVLRSADGEHRLPVTRPVEMELRRHP